LNPANPNLYRVLRDVYAEMLDLSAKNEILHMGGDEVFFGCWNATQEIVDLLESKGHGREVDDFLQLWAEFQQAALDVLDEERRKNTGVTTKIPTILWSSHLTDPKVIEKYLSKDRYIIQTWVESSATLPKELLAKGYSLIISTKNAWYFDHGFWGVTKYYPWRTVYNNRILRGPGVLGGEACLWTEFIDEHSMESRTWPRLAAVGERLWADPLTSTQEAEPRLYRHRERLILKGIEPEAITPKWCRQNEGECY
jgi:hexosaminidase